MASTYTDLLRLTLPTTGELDATWGSTVNTGITALIETALAGTANVTHDDTANYSLTTASGSADQARAMFLNVTGTLLAARNVVCPTKSKLYFIRNATTGGFAITLKTTAGTGISVPNGSYMALYCDGTNVVDAATHMSALTLATDLAVADGGTGRSTATTAYALLAAGTTATGAHQTLAAGATTEVLVGGGAAALPVWTAATGTGAPVRGTTPTIATPVINGLPTGTGVATANTVSTLVARDASGNFSAGTITATLTGTASGSQPLDSALTALAAGSDFVQFTGPLTTTKVFTLPDASSTLLVSGGALGTPASGVVTNLTGTGAFNTTGTAATVTTAAQPAITSVGTLTSLTSSGAISGTTGTFSANVANGVSTLTVVSADASATNSGGIRVRTNNTLDAAVRDWAIVPNSAAFGDLVFKVGATRGSDPLAGTVVVSLLSTGLAVTGALSASGAVSSTNAFNLNAANAIYTATGTIGWGGFSAINTGGNFGLVNDDSTGATFGTEAYGSALVSSTKPIYMRVASTNVGKWSSTGLAVTGTLSATGTITQNAIPVVTTTTINNATLPASFTTLSVSGNVGIKNAAISAFALNLPNAEYMAWYDVGGTGVQSSAIRGSGGNLVLAGNGNTATISSTGLAVTGALSATGAVSGSNLSGTNTGDQTPTSLGLVIGTNVQAYDADLTTWAGVTPGAGVATALAIAPGTTGAVGVTTIGTSASTFTFNGTGGSSTSITMTYQKIGNFVTLHIPAGIATSGTGSTTFTSDTALPAAIRPTVIQVQPMNNTANNGTNAVNAGIMHIGTTGILTHYRDYAATPWTNATLCGFQNQTTITYFVG